jgi:hypothetical protein
MIEPGVGWGRHMREKFELSRCTMDRCIAQRSGVQVTTFGLYVTWL